MGKGLLVHEWLSRTGGSENVFDCMVQTFPEADLLCLWSDVGQRYPGRDLQETWLARTPLRRSKAAALPVMPVTWRRRKHSGYDWALVSSHLFAHHLSLADQAEDFRKYVYVHSPARYIWNPELDRRGSGVLPRLIAPGLRRLDRRRAQEAVAIAANSEFVRERVRRSWERDATVIHPPVDVSRIAEAGKWSDLLDPADRQVFERLPRPFILGASRFVPYKRLDLVIACGDRLGIPVVLAGGGPDQARLRSIASDAGVPVAFVSEPSDALLFALYQEAMAFVFPGVEDFGIMPVEALAAGTAVVVGPAGGAREIVDEGTSGEVAESPDAHALAAAAERAFGLDAKNCVKRAQTFDSAVYRQRLKDWVGN